MSFDFPPIIVINLDSDSERLEHMRAQLIRERRLSATVGLSGRNIVSDRFGETQPVAKSDDENCLRRTGTFATGLDVGVSAPDVRSLGAAWPSM